MLSVTGIYDGQQIYPTEAIENKGPHKVIITFVEKLEASDEAIRSFGTAYAALDFWQSEAEDIYQDYLLKAKQ